MGKKKGKKGANAADAAEQAGDLAVSRTSTTTTTTTTSPSARSTSHHATYVDHVLSDAPDSVRTAFAQQRRSFEPLILELQQHAKDLTKVTAACRSLGRTLAQDRLARVAITTSLDAIPAVFNVLRLHISNPQLVVLACLILRLSADVPGVTTVLHQRIGCLDVLLQAAHHHQSDVQVLEEILNALSTVTTTSSDDIHHLYEIDDDPFTLFARAGGMNSLLKLARKPNLAMNATIIALVVQTLYNLAPTGDAIGATEAMVQAGALDLLANVLRDHSSNEAIFSHVSQMIPLIASSGKYSHALASSAVIERLIGVCRERGSGTPKVTKTRFALAVLSASDLCAAKIAAAGGIKLFVDALHDSPSDALLVLGTTLVRVTLAADKPVLVDPSTGIELLVNAIRDAESGSNSALLMQSLEALSTVVVRDKGACITKRTAKGVDVLLQTLRTHAGGAGADADVVRLTCAALSGFALHETARANALAAGAVDLVLQTFRAYKSNEDVAREVRAVLTALALTPLSEAGKQQIVTAGDGAEMSEELSKLRL